MIPFTPAEYILILKWHDASEMPSTVSWKFGMCIKPRGYISGNTGTISTLVLATPKIRTNGKSGMRSINSVTATDGPESRHKLAAGLMSGSMA